jgi:hypothetical protein
MSPPHLARVYDYTGVWKIHNPIVLPFSRLSPLNVCPKGNTRALPQKGRLVCANDEPVDANPHFPFRGILRLGVRVHWTRAFILLRFFLLGFFLSATAAPVPLFFLLRSDPLDRRGIAIAATVSATGRAHERALLLLHANGTHASVLPPCGRRTSVSQMLTMVKICRLAQASLHYG